MTREVFAGNRPVLTFIAGLLMLTGFAGCLSEPQTLLAKRALSSSSSLLDSKGIQLSWNPNREKAVNQVGGGYRIYYSTRRGFSLREASVVNVPYQDGLKAPTSVTLPSLTPGTYYVKVIAYSSLISPSTRQASASEASEEISFRVR